MTLRHQNRRFIGICILLKEWPRCAGSSTLCDGRIRLLLRLADSPQSGWGKFSSCTDNFRFGGCEHHRCSNVFACPTSATVVWLSTSFWFITICIDDVQSQAARAAAKDLHPKLLAGMFFFFAAGAVGGITSLVTTGDKPIFERWGDMEFETMAWTLSNAKSILSRQSKLNCFLAGACCLKGFLKTNIHEILKAIWLNKTNVL